MKKNSRKSLPTSRKSKSPTPRKGAKKPAKTDAQPLVLAYDLGGTKIAVGVVDFHGEIISVHREPALLKLGKKATLDQLIRLGKEMIDQYPSITHVGIASAGPLDPIKGLLLDPTNFKSDEGTWGIVPITEILEKGLKKPVVLENDAAAAILAEKWRGFARGYDNAMILTLGTGLGTAIIANGKLVRAGRNMHTEAGHIIIRAGDKTALCGCGNYGCAEAYLAGKSFAYRARVILDSPQIDAPQVAARARRGDPDALKMFEEYAELMAIAINNYVVLYCPEVVVLTGSFAAASDLYLESTKTHLDRLLARRNESMNLTPKIEISSLENQAGLLGGAYIAVANALGKDPK